MAHNLCISCNVMYDTGKISFEQRIIADEDFCPTCWKDIFTFSEEHNDLSFLDGLLS